MHPLPILLLVGMMCGLGPYLFALAVAGGGAFATVFGAVEFVTASFAGFAAANPVGHLRIGPPPPREDGPDPAYRSYYAGPVLLDYQRVLTRAFRQIWSKTVDDQRDQYNVVVRRSLIGKVWSVTQQSRSPYWKIVSIPPALGAAVGLVLGMVAAFGLMAMTSVIFGALLAIMVLGALITAGATRLAEFAVLFARGITVECPVCHCRATRPVYRCPDCQAAHRRLVPGLAGVLHRTCGCQYTLPTLLALGKAKLPAQCSECSAELPVKSLQAPTVHIPVIAGPTAGKSVFMHTAVARLMIMGDEEGRGFEFADPKAKAEFERNLQLGVQGDPSRITKTVVRRPRAYNVYVGRERTRARRLLYLYDPAGEIAESTDHLADAQFLTFIKGIVFVIDPFSLRPVRSATDRTVLKQVSASNTVAKAVLERFIESLRERLPPNRSNRLKLPVAVVVTKADALLGGSGVAHPYAGLGRAAVEPAMRAERDAALRTWLAEVGGGGDLLTTLDNQFTAVAFFAVSYQDAKDVTPHSTSRNGQAVANDDPAAPLFWLLDRKAYQ